MKFRQWLEFDEIDYAGVARWAQQNWGERIAPNGHPIFENFIRWFGQSKAVDGQDRPKVYHHGSQNAFTAFDKGKIGSATDHGYLGPGFYFSTWKSGAYGNHSLQVFLKVVRPCRNLDVLLRQHFGDRDLTAQDEAKISNIVKAAGHDGILGAETVVYEPTQIKALKNNGNFDPDNPDMYQ